MRLLFALCRYCIDLINKNYRHIFYFLFMLHANIIVVIYICNTSFIKPHSELKDINISILWQRDRVGDIRSQNQMLNTANHPSRKCFVNAK